MSVEIDYDKYRQRGDYHWRQISRNPLAMSAYVIARYRKCIELFEQHAGAAKGMRLLDFGCGDGAFSYELCQRGAQVWGIDPASEAVAFARLNHGRRNSSALFCCASGYLPPFPDSSFDGVLSTDVIEHVRQPERFLRSIQRVMKPGAWAVISTPIRLTEQPLDRLHVVEWFPGDFQALVGSVFPDASFYRSHPAFWGECSRRSKLLARLTNLLSLIDNPFLSTRKWELFELQYAVCQKR